MNLKTIMVTGLLTAGLFGSISPNINAASNTKLEKAVNTSANKLKKTALIGRWYQMDNKHSGMVYSIAKDGSVDWYPVGGTGNNTLVTAVKNENGWQRLTLTYVTGGNKYGFFKTTNMQINHHQTKVLLLRIGDAKQLKKHTKFIVATKTDTVLPHHQRTITVK